jgi:cell division protein FtsL
LLPLLPLLLLIVVVVVVAGVVVVTSHHWGRRCYVSSFEGSGDDWT